MGWSISRKWGAVGVIVRTNMGLRQRFTTVSTIGRARGFGLILSSRFLPLERPQRSTFIAAPISRDSILFTALEVIKNRALVPSLGGPNTKTHLLTNLLADKGCDAHSLRKYLARSRILSGIFAAPTENALSDTMSNATRATIRMSMPTAGGEVSQGLKRLRQTCNQCVYFFWGLATKARGMIVSNVVGGGLNAAGGPVLSGVPEFVLYSKFSMLRCLNRREKGS